MNYTPALADMMAKYQKTDGKMDVDSVTKWLTDNGYLKPEAKKPTAESAPKPTTAAKETTLVDKWEKAGLEILNKYGVERFTDWLSNQPLLSEDGFFGIRDIANKYGIKFPQTKREFDAEVKKNGGIDNYMGSMADTFISKMKQPAVEKKPTTKKAFPTAPVTDAVKAALKSVDNTTAAIMNLAKVLPTVYESIAKQIKLSIGKPASQQIAEAYHNAVENGVEPELVKAVENGVALQEQMKSKPSLADNIETNETLEVDGVPTGTRASNKASIDALERKHSDNATKKAVIAAVRKAARTLKSVFPSMDIHIHEDPKQYAAAMQGLKGQLNSDGNFSFVTSSDGTVVGRIDINLSTATPKVVVHEVTHAILLKMFGDNSPAFLDFRKKIEKIISTAGNAKLSNFANKYKEVGVEEIGQAEEYLAELAGILSNKETPLDYGVIRKVMELINQFVSTVTFDKFKPFQDMQDQKNALEFFNTIAQSIKAGTDVSGLAADNIFTKETPASEGEVGVFNLKSKSSIPAPKASEDSRPWIREFVTDVDLMKFDGKPFVTNMYDYTTAGKVVMGKHEIELMGGKNYVPYMMHKNNKKIGEISNLAAFNSKENAEGFVRNALEGGASLFAPHSGTKEESWQFQHHTFSELVNLVLDNNMLTNEDLIGVFNNIIKSAGNKVDFKQFRDKYFEKSGKKINNFSSFVKNPKEIVDLLDIDNNFAPKLRKTLSKTLAANKKFQEEIGIKNKEQFYGLIMDPLNAGVTGGEIIGVVEFDPATFQIVKTTPGATDHHPSFGWALMAQINGIYQPTEFYKSYDVTDTYTKYNKEGVSVSKKSDGFEDFISSNVKSSAGAIPKIAQFNVSGAKSVQPKIASKASLNTDNLTNETKRRINEQEKIDSRPDKDPGELSSLLETYSAKSNGTRGISRKSVQGTKRLGSSDVSVSAEYTLDDAINSGIQNAFPKFKGVQKIYEVTDPKAYREMMMDSLKDNPFAASVTVHSEEDFGKMRMFVTEDGSTGLTLNKEGFLGGAFSNPSANRPQNLAQLMVLGIKEGATTAEAFDTILPDYYSLFGFKAVSRTAFNDEYRPQVSNGNTVKDWDYETYKRFNNGRPDVVFFIYDGGNRNTIENRLGSFDVYNTYDKYNTKSFDENGYDSAEEVMKQQAVKRLEFDFGIKSKASLTDNNAKQVADLYAEMREGGGWSERQKINAILDQDPKLSYIYNNFKAITQMLEEAELLTKSGNCP